MLALYFISNCNEVMPGAAISVRYCGKWCRAFYQNVENGNQIHVMLERGGNVLIGVSNAFGVMIRSKGN